MDDSKKLSIDFCRKFLKAQGKSYTDEQLSQIRDVLYTFAELDYLITMQNQSRIIKDGFLKGKMLTKIDQRRHRAYSPMVLRASK